MLPQPIEIATRASLDLRRPGNRSAGSSFIDHHAVRGFLVSEFTLGQRRDGPPQRLLESARLGFLKRECRAQRNLGRDGRV